MKLFIRKYLIHILFIGLLLILIVFTFRDYGVFWDEKVFLNTGKFFLASLFTTFGIPNSLDISGISLTDYHLKGHGVFFDAITVLAALPFSNFSFETYHLIKALFAVPTFILTAYITNKVAGKKAALFAMVFLVLFPRFYGDMYTNSVDIPTALFLSAIMAYFLYLLSKQKSLLHFVFFGIIQGTAFNHRLLLTYLLPINLFVLGIYIYFNKISSLRLFVIRSIVIVVSALVAMHLTHPYLLSHPLSGLYEIILHARKYPWNAAVLFDGKLIMATNLPWYYLLKSMITTIPEFILFLFVAGLVTIIFSIVKKKQSFIKTLLYSYLLLLFITPLLLNFILRPVLYDLWRHFLFLTIPLVIIAAIGLDRIFTIKRRSIKLLILICIVLNASYVGYQMIKLHPYEYMYFNSFVGGTKGAYGKYETEYVGLSFKEAVLWFNENVNDLQKTYTVFVEGDPLSSATYFKSNMHLTTNPLEADYIFTFTRWNFHQIHKGETIHIVSKEGVPLIYIKKVN